MSAATRIGAFVVGLAVLFGTAFGIGRLFEDEPTRYVMAAAYETGGTVRLSIADGDGTLLTRYTVRHEKELHLIAVRTDFGGYRHLHPHRDADGRWTLAGVDLPAGTWRLYADFQPAGGTATVLHDDVRVPGPRTAPEPASSAATASVDGFEVALIGDLVAGESELAFRVTRNGRWVATEPYLGALGHLVVIRDSDLGYQHAHPFTGAQMAPEPPVVFGVAAPATGRYHLYFDFKIGAQVHTAAFTLEAKPGTGGDDAGGMDGMDHGSGHGDH